MTQKSAPAAVSKQAKQLRELIARGKEQGYLTYAEVNDHLPNDIVDPEQIEDIVNMINDMGIAVHEKAPDVESITLSDATATDDDGAEEAEAALASVDAEFGRTTDPVRMYMREMGTVELLTRQGEIEIAKRIEAGLNQVKYHMSHFPPTIEALLEVAGRVIAGETRMQDFVVGFIDPNEPDEIKPPVPKSDDDDDEVVDTGPDPEEVAARVKVIRRHFNRAMKYLEEYSFKDKRTQKALNDAADQIMELKLAPKLFDALVRNLRDVVSIVRSQERMVMQICVRDAGMPRKDFLSSFPKSETDMTWIDKHIRAKRKHSSILAKLKDDVLRAQRKLIAVEEATRMSIAEIKEINRQMSIGEAKARQERNGRSQPATGDLDCEEIHQPWPAVPGPDSGRQHRPYEGGGQIRISSRLQVFDLRDLVDSPGDHALDCRSGAHHSNPGAHDRNDQQAEPHLAKEPIPMETPIGDDEDSHLGDFIEDQTVHSPVDSATTSGLKETTHSVLAGLTPREAKVLRMRFGIDMNTDHTLEEVGKQFDVTRERIRQIEAKALRKLRHPTRSDQLRSFLLED